MGKTNEVKKNNNSAEAFMKSSNITWQGEDIIPKRIVIETVFGCNAKCIMCPIDAPSMRSKGFMPMDKYQKLIDDLAPISDQVEMMDLFGLGEPLLDPLIFERINYARTKGFTGLSFSTNAHLLGPDKQKLLLDTGIETIIFSIDGFDKETHEKIRVRTDYDRVVKNCCEIIKLRNEGNYKTRFVIRFIRQDSNRDQWPAYKEFWQSIISAEKRDIINCYDVHNWSGAMETKDAIVENLDPEIEREPCHHIFEKLVILANGSVSLCFEDILDAQFKFGNVFDTSPLDVFNSKSFKKIRKLHMDGKRKNLKICNGCTVLYNEKKIET